MRCFLSMLYIIDICLRLVKINIKKTKIKSSKFEKIKTCYEARDINFALELTTSGCCPAGYRVLMRLELNCSR